MSYKRILRYIFWVIVGASAVYALGIIVLIFIAFKPGSNISNTYYLGDNRTLVVDNWNCGAACSFNTKVYIERDNWYGKSKNRLFSCRGVNNVSFANIKSNSAIIDKVEGYEFYIEKCTYKEGDILKF